MQKLGMEKLENIEDKDSSLCRFIQLQNTVLRLSELNAEQFGVHLTEIQRTPFNEDCCDVSYVPDNSSADCETELNKVEQLNLSDGSDEPVFEVVSPI